MRELFSVSCPGIEVWSISGQPNPRLSAFIRGKKAFVISDATVLCMVADHGHPR
jgi:hypothetical protein